MLIIYLRLGISWNTKHCATKILICSHKSVQICSCNPYVLFGTFAKPPLPLLPLCCTNRTSRSRYTINKLRLIARSSHLHEPHNFNWNSYVRVIYEIKTKVLTFFIRQQVLKSGSENVYFFYFNPIASEFERPPLRWTNNTNNFIILSCEGTNR